MASLVERPEQQISTTELQRQGKTLLDRLQSGEQDKYVVQRDNKAAAVMLSVTAYMALMDELEDLRIDATAAERVATFDPAKAITHEEMLSRFDVTDLVE